MHRRWRRRARARRHSGFGWDRAIVFLLLFTALALLYVDHCDKFTESSALASTWRMAPAELALPQFLERFDQRQAHNYRSVSLAHVRHDPTRAWGGPEAEWDGPLEQLIAPQSEPRTAALRELPARMPRFRQENVDASRIRVTSRFGYRQLGGYYSHHDGMDVAAPYGSPIRATAPGIVVFSGWRSGYGKTVILDHGNGRETLYGHACSLSVQVGEQIEAGEVIAHVGTTGRAFGAHLHYEARYNGTAVDPEYEYDASAQKPIVAANSAS